MHGEQPLSEKDSPHIANSPASQFRDGVLNNSTERSFRTVGKNEDAQNVSTTHDTTKLVPPSSLVFHNFFLTLYDNYESHYLMQSKWIKAGKNGPVQSYPAARSLWYGTHEFGAAVAGKLLVARAQANW